MGSIIVSENITLDGVVELPQRGEAAVRVDWHGLLDADDLEAWHARLLAEVQAADALLLGRGSYEFFASRYPSRTGPLADCMNGLPKYVVSAGLQTLDALETVDRWQHSTLLSGEVVDAVAALKRAVDGDIVVYASPGLVPTLLEHDLVDELRLITYPVVVGTGRRLFAGRMPARLLRFTDAQTVGRALVLLSYRPARTAQTLPSHNSASTSR